MRTRVFTTAVALMFCTVVFPDVTAQQPSPSTPIVGMVVDAACFMMHPQAADSGQHDECGNACAVAGVPLGVFDDAGKQLYLADAKGAGSGGNRLGGIRAA
jgi:hypothetical protein